jgi:hypothetical protein
MTALKSEGNIVIAVVFILFIFFVGAGLLTFSITHSRIVRARSIQIEETGKMYQQLIHYLHRFRETIFSGSFREYIEPEIEYFNPINFPDEESGEGSIIKPSFNFRCTQKSAYEILRIITTLDITSIDAFSYKGNPYHLCAGITTDILSGKIPMSYYPVIVETNLDEPGDTFLEQCKVVNNGDGEMVAGEIETEIDFAGIIKDTFKIPGENVFVWRELREKLGLESIDEPLEMGIYTIIEATLVRAIFIQGDVSKIVFSTFQDGKEQVQVIRITLDSESYELQYIPEHNSFYSWDPKIREDLYFAEKIVVNGSVLSIKQEGQAFTSNSNIQLLVSVKAVISSDLKSMDSSLTVATAKMTNFTLAAGFHRLFRMEDETRETGIEVEKGSQINLDATLIAKGKFTNKSENLNLTGSLYCNDLENNGAIGVVQADSVDTIKTGIDSAHYFTTTRYKLIKQFFIQYIEQVSNE